MEVVLLMLMGLAWILMYIWKGAKWLFESHRVEVYNLTAKDVVATDDEAFAVTQMLQGWQNREGVIAEIQDVLDDIFGDRWRAWVNRSFWADVNSTFYEQLPGEASEKPYKEFKNVCFHLLLAKTGKVYKWYGGRMAGSHIICGLSEEESMEVFKKISLAIEKMLIEKHPDHAYDLEMMTKNEYNRYLGEQTFILMRFVLNYYGGTSGWEMLEP